MSSASQVNFDLSVPARFGELRKQCLTVAVVFGIAGIIGLIVPGTRQQFFRSYLIGYMLWLGLTLGCMALLMMQHLTGGNWGMSIRRITEAASRTVPMMALLFLPVLVGMLSGDLYPWTRPEVIAKDEHLRHLTASYLSKSGWIFRAILYFVIWGGLSYALNRWTAVHDSPPERDLHRRFQYFSAPGLVLYVFTLTFASVDWVMSLDPHWYSTMYPLLFVAGHGVSGLCFSVLILWLLVRYSAFGNLVQKDQFHDLGNLMLAFVMLWAYFSFSQWLIIWSGNIAEETRWYVERINGGWGLVAVILAALHFAVPFALLLSRELKREPARLAALAAWLIVMRWLDLFWLVEPNYWKAHFHISWLDVVVPVAIGGVWLAAFFAQLAKRPLLPVYDPYVHSFLKLAEHE
jgi:hypothetical protein